MKEQRKGADALVTVWPLVVLLAALTLAVVGCGGQGGGSAGGQPGTGSQPPPAADAEKPFYQDQTVTLIVATDPGGGYDSYARLVAPYLQKYLPGSTVIVKNVPGAGHIIGTNEIYAAEPDGLTFGLFNKGLISSQLAGLEGIKFDLSKMTWLANAAKEPRAFIVSTKTPYKTLQDVKNSSRRVLLASAGVGSSSHTDALMLKEMLGLGQLDTVAGYKGQEADLAMMRGEVDGQIGSYDQMRGLIQQGEARALLIIGSEKILELPEVPLIAEVVPEKWRSLAAFMVSQAELSRPIAGPPDIPPERVQVLRQVFAKAFADPELLAAAQKAELPIQFMDGAEAEKVVKAALNQPPEVVELIKRLMAE